MTRSGRNTWWAVAAVAVTGFLLSLVAATGADEPLEVVQVRGEAAVLAPGAGTSEGGGGRGGLLAGGSPATVGRADASVDARTVRRTRPPLRVRVPALGLDAAVRPVGVDGKRQMRLPADPRVLGWYRFGAGPGDRGSVVLAGHVDSRRFGVGPLADLQAIGVGDRIEVATGPDGTWYYEVDSTESFDRQALPAQVFARTGPARLRLVTCTGPYLPQVGGYQQNLVVTAVPV